MSCVIQTGVVLHAQCNDKCNIYVDGELAGSTTSSNEIWSGTIPRTSRLIAVAADNNDGTLGSMVVGASNGFRSSVQWRCTEDESTGWTEIGYDDSGWTVPEHQTENGGGTISVDDLYNGATPIWSKLPPNDLGLYRCRGKIGKSNRSSFWFVYSFSKACIIDSSCMGVTWHNAAQICNVK